MSDSAVTGGRKGWTVRYLDEAQRERSTCGWRQRLLSAGDDVSAFVHVVRIQDATPHYHRETTEIYYVLEGTGSMRLDGDEIPLRAGACVEIRPPTVHAVRGDVLAIVIGIPSIRDDDVLFPASGGAGRGGETCVGDESRPRPEEGSPP